MGDEEIAPSKDMVQSVWAENSACKILEYSVLARRLVHTEGDQLYVFGTIPSSSILQAHLYTTTSSMGMYLPYTFIPTFSLSFFDRSQLKLSMTFFKKQYVYQFLNLIRIKIRTLWHNY